MKSNLLFFTLAMFVSSFAIGKSYEADFGGYLHEIEVDESLRLSRCHVAFREYWIPNGFDNVYHRDLFLFGSDRLGSVTLGSLKRIPYHYQPEIWQAAHRIFIKLGHLLKKDRVCSSFSETLHKINF